MKISIVKITSNNYKIFEYVKISLYIYIIKQGRYENH